MPKSIKDAVVAAENRTFWTDPGISIRGMFRAAWVILTGGEMQGGSTITQQYIKILYLNSSQTLTRKFKELFLAYKINSEMSKEQILEGYLNTIYFGRGAYGIQAASQAYFDVDAEELTVPQAAVLASVLNNPALLDPGADTANVPRLKERYTLRDQLHGRDRRDHRRRRRPRYNRALPAFPKIKTSERYGGPKGFLLKMVERELVAAGFSESQIQGGGLKITTTFDKSAQNAAVKAAQRNTRQAVEAADKKASDLHAAVASVEVGSGRGAGPLRRSGLRGQLAQLGHDAAARPRPRSRRTRWPPGWTTASACARPSTATPSPRPAIRPRCGTSSPTSTGRTSPLLRATADSINTAFVDLTTRDEG